MITELKSLEKLQGAYLAVDGVEMKLDVSNVEVVGKAETKDTSLHLVDAAGAETSPIPAT